MSQTTESPKAHIGCLGSVRPSVSTSRPGDLDPTHPRPQPSLTRHADLPAEEATDRTLLDDLQIEALERYGSEHDVTVGDVLVMDGDDTYDLVVILEGEVQIVERYGQPDQAVIVSLGPREFLGEIGLLTGQRAYLTAIVSAEGRVLRGSASELHVVIAQEPKLSEPMLRAFLLRHDWLIYHGSGLTLVGSRFDVNIRSLREVLVRNRLSFSWLELEGCPEAEALLRELNVPVEDLPIVMIPGRPLLRNPRGRDLLEALGVTAASVSVRPQSCDLLVVGGGPAGLAAALYGASEGLSTILAEDTGLGGQAGTSSRIENYLGFPAGLSGQELAARASLQATKFGVRLKLASRATAMSSALGSHEISFDGGDTVTARAVIIATGARYNRLSLDRLSEFEGVGVYYAATPVEAQACAGRPVVIAGGGNSAGQAALFLARTSSQVHLIIRGATLASSMSRYLLDRIDRHPRIHVAPHREIVGLVGDQALEGVRLRDKESQRISTLAVSGMFVFIGATPSTRWLDGQLAADTHDFLLTGADIPASRLEQQDVSPLPLETSRAGVFAIGDVRSGSMKRVATAIGDGSMAVSLVLDRIEPFGATSAAV
jgi:thioredoxin reductase (NADPH)